MSFRFSSVSLGCSKNLVDLEFAIGEILKFSDRMDIEYYDTPEDPEVEYVLINTCGFLSSAREESEMTMRQFDELGKKIILMGCYVNVKDDTFLTSLKNLHAILPFTDYTSIEKLLLGGNESVKLTPKNKIEKLKWALSSLKETKLREYLSSVGWDQRGKKAFVWKGDEIRAYIHSPFGYEYLKIAEGCDNNCTFCIIPRIRGRQKSRPIEDVLKEVHVMLDNGISEIEIICQDTTRYGTDLIQNQGDHTGSPLLYDLLEQIDAIPGDFRFRVFYMYPDTLTMEHLKRLSKLKKFIPYFDIPFQHFSASILRRMGRFYNQESILEMLAFIRKHFPGAWVRTSFIIGFPGETDADFAELCQFIKEQRFESVGIFQYHDEPLAASSKLDEKIDEKTTISRMKKLWKILDNIYEEHAKSAFWKKHVGYIMGVEKDVAIIRREIQAPEIDEYDEVPFDNIIWTDDIGIGDFVEYSL